MACFTNRTVIMPSLFAIILCLNLYCVQNGYAMARNRRDVFRNIDHAANDTVGGTKNATISAWDATSYVAGKTAEVANSTFQGIKKMAASAWESTKDAAKSLPPRNRRGVFENIGQAADDTVQGTKNMANSAWDATSGFVDKTAQVACSTYGNTKDKAISTWNSYIEAARISRSMHRRDLLGSTGQAADDTCQGTKNVAGECTKDGARRLLHRNRRGVLDDVTKTLSDFFERTKNKIIALWLAGDVMLYHMYITMNPEEAPKNLSNED